MSASELFDIVDDQNRPTGQVVSRAEAHQQGLRHRTVHIYVFQKRDGIVEILVHLRAPWKDASPSTWDARFGGHITSGHEPLETAVRELEEEAGLSIVPSDLVVGPLLRWDEADDNEINYIFGYDGASIDVSTLRFNDGEVQAVKWMAMDTIISEVSIHPDQWSGGAQLRPVVEQVRDWIKGL